jgi:hypothetical protein
MTETELRDHQPQAEAERGQQRERDGIGEERDQAGPTRRITATVQPTAKIGIGW